MSGPPAIQAESQFALERALSSLNYEQTSALCIMALRTMRRSGLRESTVIWDMATLQRHLYPLLLDRAGVQDVLRIADLQTHLTYPFAAHVLRFLLWLQDAGLGLH